MTNSKSNEAKWKTRSLTDLGTIGQICVSAASLLAQATVPLLIFIPATGAQIKSLTDHVFDPFEAVGLPQEVCWVIVCLAAFWFVPFLINLLQLVYQANSANEVFDRNEARKHSVAVRDLDAAEVLKSRRTSIRIWQLVRFILSIQQTLLLLLLGYWSSALIAAVPGLFSLIVVVSVNGYSNMAVAKRYLASICEERDENLPNANKGEIKDLLDRIKSLEEKIEEEDA